MGLIIYIGEEDYDGTSASSMVRFSEFYKSLFPKDNFLEEPNGTSPKRAFQLYKKLYAKRESIPLEYQEDYLFWMRILEYAARKKGVILVK